MEGEGGMGGGPGMGARGREGNEGWGGGGGGRGKVDGWWWRGGMGVGERMGGAEMARLAPCGEGGCARRIGGGGPRKWTLGAPLDPGWPRG